MSYCLAYSLSMPKNGDHFILLPIFMESCRAQWLSAWTLDTNFMDSRSMTWYPYDLGQVISLSLAFLSINRMLW